MKALRAWLWPIKSEELSRFLPIFFIKMCASFNFSILATVKDTVIVTANGAGAEAIPVLKGGVVIIFAFLTMLLYSKLSNIVSRRNLFYLMILPFLVFFLAYGFVLFPYQETLSFNASADWLLGLSGGKYMHWIAVYRYWMHSLFFVIAEIWGGVVIGLLFWGFVNQITNIKDATRFYVLYSTGGHIGTLLSGSIILISTSLLKTHHYQDTIMLLMSLATIIGCVILALYWYTNHKMSLHIEDSLLIIDDLGTKTKLSLKESLRYIASSPYLGLIAMMVIGYGLSVNLVEVTWKSLVNLQYPNPSDYQSFMGTVQFILGAASLITAMFFGSAIMRKFGWYISAQITPVVLAITSLIFFALYFMFPDLKDSTVTIFSLTPLMLLVVFGALHNVACKTMKYCMFDPTKEMAYIPLEAEAKTKGKAAVDLVGARFGKTGSSWIQLLLIDLIGSGSILTVVPFLVPVIAIVVFCWFKSVLKLNKRFNNIQDKLEKDPDYKHATQNA